MNLVKNAAEAMDNGGTISIMTRPSGNQVEITVADEGCGIPGKDREKIFSPFFTTKSHGTGLGLSITKRIIDEHAGSSLSVESEEGKGTTFTIRLPVYRDSTGGEKSVPGYCSLRLPVDAGGILRTLGRQAPKGEGIMKASKHPY